MYKYNDVGVPFVKWHLIFQNEKMSPIICDW